MGNIDCILSTDETVVLPNLQRMSTNIVLCNQYQEYLYNDDGEYKKGISRTIFHNIPSKIAATVETVMSSLDDVQLLLVHEPIKFLGEIVNKLHPNHQKERLSHHLSLLSIFIKNA